MQPLALLPLLIASLPLSPHYEAAQEHQFEADVTYQVSPTAVASAVPTVPSKLVYGFLPYWVKTDPNTFRWNVLTHVIYFSAEISEVGDIKNTHGWFDAKGKVPLVDIAHQHGRKALISAYVPGDLSGLLRIPTRRANAIQKMIALVQTSKADGLDIDFEPVKNDQAEDLFVFMRDLSAAFRAALPNAELTMDVYAWPPFYLGYDIKRLTPFVDRFLIMGYNYHWKGAAQAGPNSPLTGGKAWKLWVQRSVESVDGYLNLAPKEKLVLGVPYYAYDWPVTSATAVPAPTNGMGFSRNYNEVVNQARSVRQWDLESQTPWYSYNDGGPRQVWYEDAQSLGLKYEYVKNKGLSGVMIWALGFDEGYPELWDALVKHFPPLISVPNTDKPDAGAPDAGAADAGTAAVDAGTIIPPGPHVPTTPDPDPLVEADAGSVPAQPTPEQLAPNDTADPHDSTKASGCAAASDLAPSAVLALLALTLLRRKGMRRSIPAPFPTRRSR